MTSPHHPGPLAGTALFLDRDGTMIDVKNGVYLDDLEQMRLYPGVAGAIRAANRAGMTVAVVTNQSGVARGFFDEKFVLQCAHRLETMLLREGARLDGHFHCPHHPEGQPPYNIVCDCRKPAPGMMERAVREMGVKLRGAYMVGDKIIDMETGADQGVVPILVRTGYGRESEAALLPNFWHRGGRVFDDLTAAIAWITARR